MLLQEALSAPPGTLGAVVVQRRAEMMPALLQAVHISAVVAPSIVGVVHAVVDVLAPSRAAVMRDDDALLAVVHNAALALSPGVGTRPLGLVMQSLQFLVHLPHNYYSVLMRFGGVGVVESVVVRVVSIEEQLRLVRDLEAV